MVLHHKYTGNSISYLRNRDITKYEGKYPQLLKRTSMKKCKQRKKEEASSRAQIWCRGIGGAGITYADSRFCLSFSSESSQIIVSQVPKLFLSGLLVILAGYIKWYASISTG